jgi:hypothetical protein
MFGWQLGEETPRTSANAFNGANASRIGFYDEGFMGNADHYAFFAAYPNEEKAFVEADTDYVVIEGEPSHVTSYNTNDDVVRTTMERYHWTALNIVQTDTLDIYNIWKTNNDFDTITKKMGYRFVLLESEVSDELHYAGGYMTIRLLMANIGYARPMNPRSVEIILRNGFSQIDTRVLPDLPEIPRLWLPGPGETNELYATIQIPSSIPGGEYHLLLNLPDPTHTLSTRPEYSIRLANTTMWEAGTGYNALSQTVYIDSDYVPSESETIKAPIGLDGRPKTYRIQDTAISFRMPTNTIVKTARLSIFDERGGLVASIENEGMNEEGITWNGSDAQGIAVSPGAYIYTMKVELYNSTIEQNGIFALVP